MEYIESSLTQYAPLEKGHLKRFTLTLAGFPMIDAYANDFEAQMLLKMTKSMVDSFVKNRKSFEKFNAVTKKPSK